jgi:hypothetical protein
MSDSRDIRASDNFSFRDHALLLELGPVTISAGARLALSVQGAPPRAVDVQVPESASERREALLFIMATTGFTGWLGGAVVPTTPAAELLGGAIGFVWGVVTWNALRGR